MKNLIRTRCFVILLFAGILFSPSSAKAGPFASACIAACLVGCVATGPAYVACAYECSIACSFSCFGSGTKISVLTEGKLVSTDIEHVMVGDKVSTLKDGQLAWTTVVRNVRTQGNFNFVQITAQDMRDGREVQVKVTEEHGMVLSQANGNTVINTASNVQIGDKMLAANGNILLVKGIERLTMKEKYTLETSEGTVLASDLLMTTLCHEVFEGGERPFNSTIENWRAQHNFSH